MEEHQVGPGLFVSLHPVAAPPILEEIRLALRTMGDLVQLLDVAVPGPGSAVEVHAVRTLARAVEARLQRISAP